MVEIETQQADIYIYTIFLKIYMKNTYRQPGSGQDYAYLLHQYYNNYYVEKFLFNMTKLVEDTPVLSATEM